MVRFQPCGRFEGVSGVFAAFLPPILAGGPRDFLSFDRPVRTGSDTSRQRRRESLVEPLCHFLRARRRLLCIAIPVYVAELFFYVSSRRHDSCGDARLLRSVHELSSFIPNPPKAGVG